MYKNDNNGRNADGHCNAEEAKLKNCSKRYRKRLETCQKTQMSGTLYRLVETKNWEGAIQRCQTHPQDVMWSEHDWIWTSLHKACSYPDGAPDHVVKALIDARPQAATVESLGPMFECSWLPLHEACSQRVSHEVLRMILLAAPEVASAKDKYFGLKPFDLLWYGMFVVDRTYFGAVITGNMNIEKLNDFFETIGAIENPSSLVGDLGKFWADLVLILDTSKIGDVAPILSSTDPLLVLRCATALDIDIQVRREDGFNDAGYHRHVHDNEYNDANEEVGDEGYDYDDINAEEGNVYVDYEIYEEEDYYEQQFEWSDEEGNETNA
eukprot:CAMPEP_0185733664 /NCGR_PEP_ID=MMETSP1171-20130828/20260_1 /TAXON_ID=374046 /ORGANISM="Helicotheca tamensis, Strain CCMP826" /LENGTH=323 /DNA_ID=CAMNT_0028403445 /DNA_START=100 /DNA_END=1067 /DNA_ORIENTATION=-